MKKILILFLIFGILGFSSDFLTLNECIRIAIKNNLNIGISKDLIEKSFYEKEISKTYFYPRLTTSFNYTYLGDNEPVSFGNFPPLKFTEDNIYNLKLTLTYPVFTGKRIQTQYEISKRKYETSKIEYEKQISDLILNVKKSYFEILKAMKFLDTSKKYKENIERHLDNAKKMFKQGIVTKLDILKTELALKEAETKIIESINYLDLTKANLNFILNRPIDSDFEIEDIFEIKEDKKDYQFWKENALQKRPEIKQMEEILAIYRENIKMEKSNLYPQISFFLNYNLERGSQSSLNQWDTNWNTGILISYDIWNAGETKNKIKKAEIEKNKVEKELQLLKNSIELEVKNAYLNFLLAEEKIEKLKKQIEVAEENLRVAELLYNEGLATTLDVLDANTSLINAYNDYYSAVYDYKMSYSNLEKVSGLLKWEEK